MNGLNDAYVESVIKKAISGKLKTGQTAAKLGINKQYVNTLKKAYSEKGPSCFARGSKTSYKVSDHLRSTAEGSALLENLSWFNKPMARKLKK